MYIFCRTEERSVRRVQQRFEVLHALCSADVGHANEKERIESTESDLADREASTRRAQRARYEIFYGVQRRFSQLQRSL